MGFGPRTGGHGATILDEEQTARVVAFVRRVGVVASARRLGVSPITLDNARFRGRIAKTTADRLMATLEREESLLEVAS